MLIPSKLDPNYKAEMERRNKDPASFGMSIPIADTKLDLSWSGLAADRDKGKVAKVKPDTELWKEYLTKTVAAIVAELGDLDKAQIESMRDAEMAGKARVVLLSAIEKELSSR